MGHTLTPATSQSVPPPSVNSCQWDPQKPSKSSLGEGVQAAPRPETTEDELSCRSRRQINPISGAAGPHSCSSSIRIQSNTCPSGERWDFMAVVSWLEMGWWWQTVPDSLYTDAAYEKRGLTEFQSIAWTLQASARRLLKLMEYPYVFWRRF